MDKADFGWEADLLKPPLAQAGSDDGWMELVVKRLEKRRTVKRFSVWAGSVAAVLALVFFAANGDYFRDLYHSIEERYSGHHTLEKIVKYHSVDGLMIEEGAQIQISKKADLLEPMNEATIALVVLPLEPERDYEGYLGIWDAEGQAIQKFALEGYHMMNPVQIYVQDVTGDGNPDIVLETDEGANGGFGAHAVQLYVKQRDRYVSAPLTEEVNASFAVLFRPSGNDFIVTSEQDHREWTVTMNAEQLKELDSALLSETNIANVDSISSIDIGDNGLTTRRLVWFGHLQLNSLAVLATRYTFENNMWAVQEYQLESIENSTVVTETIR